MPHAHPREVAQPWQGRDLQDHPARRPRRSTYRSEPRPGPGWGLQARSWGCAGLRRPRARQRNSALRVPPCGGGQQQAAELSGARSPRAGGGGQQVPPGCRHSLALPADFWRSERSPQLKPFRSCENRTEQNRTALHCTALPRTAPPAALLQLTYCSSSLAGVSLPQPQSP